MERDIPDFRRLFESVPALYMVLAADPPRFTVLAASDAYLRAVEASFQRAKSRDAGFDHHLPKPPDLATLEEILGDCGPGAVAGAS